MADVKSLFQQAAQDYKQNEHGAAAAPQPAVAPAMSASPFAAAAADYQKQAAAASAPSPTPAQADTRGLFDKLKDRLLLRSPASQPTPSPAIDTLGPTPLDRTLSSSLERAVQSGDIGEAIPGPHQGKIAITALINALNGWKGGPAGMAANGALSELGQDDNWQGAMGGLVLGQSVGGVVDKMRKAGGSVPLPQSWQRAAAQNTAEAGSQIAGYLGGTAAGGGEMPDPTNLALMAALAATHVVGGAPRTLGSRGAREGAIKNTPGYVSEQAIQDIGTRQGRANPSDLVGNKNQFSGLPSADGTATMAPAMPDVMQAVMDHLSDIGQTTAKGVRAAVPTPTAMSSVNPMNAVIAALAKKVTPKAQQNVQPADVAPGPEQPPKKDDKLKPNEESSPALAGSGGKPVSAPGSGPVPGDVPPAPAVAPSDAKVGRGYGRTSSVSIPETDTRYPVRYRLRELDDLNASHNEQSFDYNPKYPYENERDYSLDVNQPRVVDNSKPGKFEHARIINDAPEATSGPPITDENGNVMGGNNRTMMLKRAFADPATVEQHRALLREKASQFGVDAAELDKMKKPVLVREMEPGAVTKENAQDIIADYNVDPSARKSLEEQAMSDAKRLKPEHWDHLGKIIEEMPEGETMRGILGDPRRGPGIVHYLTDTGVFKKNELAKLLTEEGAVTAEAKDRIENMLVGRMFRDARQMVNTPSEVKQKLGGIAGIVARLRNYPEWDITHQLPEAISALEHGRVNGFSNLGDMNKQMDLSGKTANFDDSTLAIADALKKRGPKVFANKLKTYLQHAETANGARPGNMFEEPKGLEQAFSEAFDAPRGLKPAPRPSRAPMAVGDAEPQAAGEPATPPDHNLVAKSLHDEIETKLKGRANRDDLVAPGALTGEQAGPIREMIDAASQIPEEDFQLLFKKRYARAKGRPVTPDYRESVPAAVKRLGERFGYDDAEASQFADDLANLHHKVSGPGGAMADWSESKSHAIPFKATLDKLRAATEAAPKAAPAAAPPAAPAPEPPKPAAEPKATKEKPGARTVQDFEAFLNGGFGGGTLQNKGGASGTGVGVPLPSAAGKLGTSGYEPGVQRAVASASKGAASELANSTQSPAARTAGRAEAPSRPLPVATEKLGTAGYEPRVQGAEDAAFNRMVEQQQASARQKASTTALAAHPSGPAEPPTQPLPASTDQVGTAAYDTRDYKANPGKTQKQIDAEADVAAKEKAKQEKADAAAAKKAAKPTDQQMLDDLMGKAYDGAKRTFRADLAETLREHERLHPGTLDRATQGNAKTLLQYADNLTTVWNRWGKMVEPNGQAKGVFRAWFSLIPELGHMRVGHDIPHYFNSVAADTQLPASPSQAYQTMRYLAQHPETPRAYVMEALRALRGKDKQAKQ